MLVGGLLAAVPAHAASARAARGHAPTETVLRSFQASPDGGGPLASLIKVDGTLYGTTYGGGPTGLGTVFEITAAGVETVLYNFKGGADGSRPEGKLVNEKGTLYGVTTTGGTGTACGSQGCGTVFSLSPGGAETVLYSFQGGSDGSSPESLRRVGNKFFGTTYNGGPGNCFGGCGTVFSVTKAGVESVVYSFQGGSDGRWPYAGLIDVGGTLYGTTWLGGASTFGTVFSVTTTGVETVLHAFGSGTDGSGPVGGLINVGGTFYGTTSLGGAAGAGTVYSVTPSGQETVLYSFLGQSSGDGSTPGSSLINAGGVLYGLTQRGGTGTACNNGCGTVFKVTPAGVETPLYSFQGGSDGELPYETDLIKMGGVLYGTTPDGGAAGQGTVFQLTHFR